MLPVGEAVLAALAAAAIAGAVLAWVWWARLGSQSKGAPATPERPLRDTLPTGGGVEPQDRRHTYALRAGGFIAGICMVFVLLIYLRQSGSVNHGDQSIADLVVKVQLLRGDFEAHNPGWSFVLRDRGLELASLMAAVDPQKLRPGIRIVQREYRGWALLIVARTFGAEAPEDGAQVRRIQYATQALRDLDIGLTLMQGVERSFKTGSADKDTLALYKWMHGPSDDVERSQYLKAVALAVIAKAGGPYFKADVKRELAALSSAYLAKYPPKDNPDLKWALDL